MKSLQERKAQLEARKAELTKRLGKIENTLDEEPNPDVEERATEREGDEVLEGLGESSDFEVRMIESALDRIDTGTYGECMECGETISQERLDLLPYTPFCRNCAG